MKDAVSKDFDQSLQEMKAPKHFLSWGTELLLFLPIEISFSVWIVSKNIVDLRDY